MESTTKGVVLCFRDSDLWYYQDENRAVAGALRKANCPAETIHFNSSSFQTKFGNFLDGSEPKIVYVNGHGGPMKDSPGDLILCSHGLKTEKYCEIEWAIIQDLVNAARCDVLVIVDCCHAGLAKINPYDDDYAKELIAATSWDSSTYDKLAPSLVSALATWHQNSGTRSSTSLYLALTAALEDMRLGTGDKIIQELQGKRNDAEIKMRELLREKNKLFSGAGRPRDGSQEYVNSVEKEIRQHASLIKSLDIEIKSAKKKYQKLNVDPKHCKQPIFRPARSRVNRHWAARQVQHFPTITENLEA
ncbi:hypothetical protein ABW21_db0205694 [Orbilia brochopaga]|nr:hypothetical protein ABW21_db0205694 [Drechslerella brochopaga]